MQQWTVRDVMTAEVLTVDYDTSPAEVVGKMTAYDVSAVAVADRHNSVRGIVTRTDVLNAIEMRAPQSRSRAPWRRPTVRPAWTKQSAGQMMSAPALTIRPDATLAEAGRLMRHREVNRLLVTGADRRLLGVVTAADLLKVYERDDEAIRADVRETLAALPARDLAFDVHDGVARLAGTVVDAPTATLVTRVVRDVPGVTAVRSEVTVRPSADSATQAVPPRHQPSDDWWPTRRADTQRPTAASAARP